MSRTKMPFDVLFGLQQMHSLKSVVDCILAIKLDQLTGVLDEVEGVSDSLGVELTMARQYVKAGKTFQLECVRIGKQLEGEKDGGPSSVARGSNGADRSPNKKSGSPRAEVDGTGDAGWDDER